MLYVHGNYVADKDRAVLIIKYTELIMAINPCDVMFHGNKSDHALINKCY